MAQLTGELVERLQDCKPSYLKTLRSILKSLSLDFMESSQRKQYKDGKHKMESFPQEQLYQTDTVLLGHELDLNSEKGLVTALQHLYDQPCDGDVSHGYSNHIPAFQLYN